MEAAARGARDAGGLTIGLLPGSDPREANAYIDVPLATGMGEMRNALIVRAAGAVIAVGGSHGTLSEVALALRIGTPIVGVQDRFAGAVDMPRVGDASAAVSWALARASAGQLGPMANRRLDLSGSAARASFWLQGGLAFSRGFGSPGAARGKGGIIKS
jgi:hypothetical protein